MQTETVAVRLIVAADGALRTLDQFDSAMTDSANASVKAGAGVDAMTRQLERMRRAQEAGVPVMKARAAVLQAEERALASVLGKADVVAKARINAERDISRAAAAASNLVVQGRLAEAEATRQLMAIEAAHAAQVERAIAASAGRPGVSNFNTANVAAQFQDIGVTAAMGMSPLQIALQQGTQLSAVLGGQGLTGVVKTLGAAFASVFSPVSLLTIGVVALGAAGIQAMMSLQQESKSAADLLEEHRAALGKIVNGYERAESAVSDYAAQLERIPRAIAALQLNEQFDQIRQDVADVTDQAANFGSLFDGYGSSAEQAFATVSAQFARGELSAEGYFLALQDVRTQLNGLESALGAVSVARLIDQMEQGAMKAMAFGDAISNLVAQTHALAGLSVDATLQGFFEANSPEKALDALKGLTPELRTQKQIIEDTYAAALANPILSAAGRDELTAAYNAALDAQTVLASRQGAKAGSASFDQWGGNVDSFQQRIASQRLEIALLGHSTYEIERQKAAFDLLNQARQSGVIIDKGVTDQISIMSEQYAAATVELERMAQAQRVMDEQLALYRDTFSGFFSDLKGGLKQGQSFWEAFGNAGANALDKIADRALSMAANGLFDMIFGAVMGGFTGGFGQTGGTWGKGLWGSAIFNANGNVYNSPSLGAYSGGVYDSPQVFTFANGGVPNVGVFGEAGPEAIMPLGRDGQGRLGVRVAANDNGGGGTSIVMHNTIAVPPDSRPGDGARFAAEFAKELKRQLPDAMKVVERNPNRRAA